MSDYSTLESSRVQRTLTFSARLLQELRIDGSLLLGLSLVGAVGIIVFYSASGCNLDVLQQQGLRFVLALIAMCALALVSPRMLRTATPWVCLLSLVLLT